ncbi:PDZ domain-containing protein [Salsipaludibacter albus]|uniref:YlbL family protein n=1 Tax=Salsipaludibacter albus TaxID=2849650 RepID=UPI002367B6C2|nr:PDZ domain-containing protein [Salsipaludibacter albus]MBY5164332.1 PDZ domain-containing protein [Salsipaludibacter albus]
MTSPDDAAPSVRSALGGSPPPDSSPGPGSGPAPDHPEAGRPRRRWPRAVAWVLAAVVFVGLVVGGLWVAGVVPCSALTAQPECWVAMLPGPTRSVEELVELGGIDTYGSDGELLLTTVLVDNRLTVREYVDGVVSDDIALIPREELYPPGRSVEDARFENEILMSDSQLEAKVAALDELGIPFEDLDDGAEVVQVVDDSPASDTDLAAGDVFVAVDGRPVGDVDAAVSVLGSFAPGDVVDLQVRGPDDEERSVEVELGDNPDDPGAPFVGVLLRNYQELPVDITIDAGAIGGPSAGLAFSLGIVDRATPEDLTGGRDVAVTGTITGDGQVGPIGGIVQKIVGAVESDPSAEVFLVPAGNWEEAQLATPPRPVTLVEVATLDDAVHALEDLAAGREPESAIAVG